MDDIGTCWLCQRKRELTSEHFPPRAAFNDRPLLSRRMSEMSRAAGRVVHEWSQEPRALSALRFCKDCNNRRLGAAYDTVYSDFVHSLAERCERARHGDWIDVDVHYPLRIVKAVARFFLLSNGEAFAQKHEWLRGFLMDRHSTQWPDHVGLYLYVCAFPGGRSSGPVGQIKWSTGRVRILSEFSFFPVGALLSFQPLDSEPVVPVHGWAKRYGYKDRGPALVSLPVWTFATEYPLDFRSPEEVRRAVEGSRRGDG